MTQSTDCLLIGHNQVPFDQYEATLRKMGENSGAYRDLAVNTIRWQGGTWNPADLFNSVCVGNAGRPIEKIRGVEVLSAAIAYLGTYLTRRGMTFDYVNSFQDDKAELARKLENDDIRTVAIISTLYITAFPVLEIIDFVRRHNDSIKILVGGPFVTTKVRTLDREPLEYLLRSVGADVFVNSSQGEATLVRILETMKNGGDLSEVPNVYYKSGKSYVQTPTVGENNPIEDNMVDWSLFDSRRVPRFVNVRTAISCPFSCSFCGFPEHAGEYQYASVERVEEELNSLSRCIHPLTNVTFTDDTFNIPPKRFKELLRMMIKNDYGFTWSAFFRCQFADEETVKLMAESKCESVFLGLESADNIVLRNMNKAASVEDFRRGIDLLKRYGIVSFANFVVGFPGETEETVDETIAFIDESGIDFFRAQVWYCEHITPVWRERERYELTGESFEWKHSTMDSRTAADMVKKIVLTVKNTTRLPQYYFDYDNVMQLTHKGVTLAQVKQFMRSYDDGVKEKLRDPTRDEASFEVLRGILSSVREAPAQAAAGLVVPSAEADFTF